jgi:hypothetical protein
LSTEWTLSTLEKIELYLACADALDSLNDSNGAFKIYYEAFSLITAIDHKKKDKALYNLQAEKLIVNAIKCPKVTNFKELSEIESVK